MVASGSESVSRIAACAGGMRSPLRCATLLDLLGVSEPMTFPPAGERSKSRSTGGGREGVTFGGTQMWIGRAVSWCFCRRLLLHVEEAVGEKFEAMTNRIH